MEQVQELVPKYNQVRDLYQLADFQVLAQFLNDSKIQLEQELLSLEASDKEFKEKAFSLIKQINLLGTVSRLPQIILEIKKELERREFLMNDQQKAAYDPLNKE